MFGLSVWSLCLSVMQQGGCRNFVWVISSYLSSILRGMRAERSILSPYVCYCLKLPFGRYCVCTITAFTS